jgi:hypothetical protein
MSSTVDKELVEQVLAEYMQLEKRFYLGDWSPADVMPVVSARPWLAPYVCWIEA